MLHAFSTSKGFVSFLQKVKGEANQSFLFKLTIWRKAHFQWDNIYCLLFWVKSLGISFIFLKSPVTYIANTIRGRICNIYTLCNIREKSKEKLLFRFLIFDT